MSGKLTDSARRRVYHGYDDAGDFSIKVVTTSVDGSEGPFEDEIQLTRLECQKIAKHMQFGKKGEERVFESAEGKEVKLNGSHLDETL